MPRLPQSTPSSRSLYQLFLAEREEVLKHKWLQSEEAGHDVGLETALVDWAKNHRENWRNNFFAPLP